MINTDELHFERLDIEGLKTLVRWAELEGWNPGSYDADVFFATDPEGFYGYFNKGELIAGGSVVSYNGEFGFMGFFIVKPEYRAKGVGRKLWYERRNHLLQRLKSGASIGMDGVVDMQPFYNKGGFEIHFRDERHEKTGQPYDVDANISAINDADFESIVSYDKQCFGFSRSQFLKPWLNLPEGKTFKYVKDDALKGFAVLRKVKSGFKICPLFADSPEIAEALYKSCLNAVPGQPVYLDIPMINKAAVQLTKAFNTNYVFECARMYYGQAPDIPIHKIFGVTSFELG